MGEPLTQFFGPDVPRRIADQIRAVHAAFPRARFLRNALQGYEPLNLMARGRKIARALHDSLPRHFPEAIPILLASLESAPPKQDGDRGMAPFFYLPHTLYVAEYGLDHFGLSMQAQYELTQRFTAEFSIRPFLERYPEATLAQLKVWAIDPSPDVRRLVSEGTRPRLPWAPRLRAFQRDPRPVLALLELLKDDSELYVRRSVANNLNDIGKDHPALLAATAQAWLRGASEERHWIIRHALRSAVKRGEPGALRVLGAGRPAQVLVRKRVVSPKMVTLGNSVAIGVDLINSSPTAQHVIADFQIHFVKANGKAAPKVFKLKTLNLTPGARVRLRKTVSLKSMTTRRHHPGKHRVELLLNGRAQSLGQFDLTVP